MLYLRRYEFSPRKVGFTDDPYIHVCHCLLSIIFTHYFYHPSLLSSFPSFPSPGHLPNLGIGPGSPALQADSLPSEPLGKPIIFNDCQFNTQMFASDCEHLLYNVYWCLVLSLTKFFFNLTFIVEYRRRQWHPTPALLPGESHGWRSLVGCYMGSLQVRHNWTTSLSFFIFMHWRRKWQPAPVFLPGESQGRGSLVGCHLWGPTESDMTEVT